MLFPNAPRHHEFNPKPHPKHFNTPGHAHGLTFCCYNRHNYLLDPHACEILLCELAKVRAEHRLHVWAYVFMPNHVHLLIWPRERTYSISRIQNDLKGRAAKRYRDHVLENRPEHFRSYLLNERGREIFRLWEHGGGYDRNLWRAQDIRRTIAYIERNPVKRGLVARPEEYRWSSAYARATGDGLVPDSFSIPVALANPRRPRAGLT